MLVGDHVVGKIPLLYSFTRKNAIEELYMPDIFEDSFHYINADDNYLLQLQ